MVGSRAATALVGLAASVAVSVAIYLATGWLLVFLVVPFVPFLFTSSLGRDADDRPTVRSCPECDFRTPNPDHEYCPHDGRRLRET